MKLNILFVIFSLIVSSKCNSCLLYTMDLACDARQYHTELKEHVATVHPLDEKIRIYILAGYHLFSQALAEDYDYVFQIVVYIFKDLKVYPPSLLHAVLDATPHHIALNAAIYRKVKDAFVCVMNDGGSSSGRKRTHDLIRDRDE